MVIRALSFVITGDVPQHVLAMRSNEQDTLHTHQVVISERNRPLRIYDVSALLWVLAWPSDKLHVYVDAFLLFVHQALQKSNVTRFLTDIPPTAP